MSITLGMSHQVEELSWIAMSHQIEELSDQELDAVAGGYAWYPSDPSDPFPRGCPFPNAPYNLIPSKTRQPGITIPQYPSGLPQRPTLSEEVSQ